MSASQKFWFMVLLLVFILQGCGGGGGGGDSSPAADTGSTHSISGKVVNSSNVAIPEVYIALIYSTNTTTITNATTTDANGEYTFPNLSNKSYTIRPAKSGYTFAPTITTITVNNLNVTGQDFVGSAATDSGGTGAVKLPKTGQTTSYSADDDGVLQKGVAWPSPRFTNIDGTTPISSDVVVDQLTGLMWTKDGDAPGPSACDPGVPKTWLAALDYVACLNTNSYLGYADWYLPNRNELRSLVNYGESYDIISDNTWLTNQGFINVPDAHAWPDGYWSSTTLASNTLQAFSVYIFGGAYASGKTADHLVWPVRAGQGGAVDIPQTGQSISYATGDDGELQKGVAWPNPRFTVNTDTTITDNLTGLVWPPDIGKPEVNDVNGNPNCGYASINNQSAAFDNVACLNTISYLGYTDWRLPNVNELVSLVHAENTNSETWLNTQGFSNEQTNGYWSSTTYDHITGDAWYVRLWDGYVGNNDKSLSGYACIPVRGGQ